MAGPFGKSVVLIVTVALALATLAAPSAGAQSGPSLPPVDLPGVDPSILAALEDPTAPLDEVDPERYLPSPSPDPWYSDPPELVESTPNGTILDTRPATIPWFNAIGVGPTWQLLVQTRDSRDRPVAVPSTVIIPAQPWRGPGPRPILSFAVAIDGLGNKCQPSWAMTQGVNIQFPPILQVLIARGYGVVVTDHHGPRGAYGASRMNGHALLDGIRAARAFEPAGLGDSPAAIFGYSGGGIAAGGAAQMQAVYAPEMSEYLVGSAVGGVPVDLGEALEFTDGTIGAGLMRSAILGIAREYPAMYELLNRTGDAVAFTHRDTCAEFGTAAGIVTAPINSLTTMPDPVNDPRVREMIEDTRLGTRSNRPGEIPGAPVLLFSADAAYGIGPLPGPGDQFFPESRLRDLQAEWCAAGADVDYIGVPGEHVTGMFTAPRPVLDWIDRRYDLYEAGLAAPRTCGI
ncbi:MAG: lipase family protein [Dietzia sp.]